MERALSYLYVFPLIVRGAWSRLIHPGETDEEYLTRTHPGTVVKHWNDGTE